MAVDSGFESCVLNLPGSSQELNIDALALNEVDAVRQVSKIVKNGCRIRVWHGFNSFGTL